MYVYQCVGLRCHESNLGDAVAVVPVCTDTFPFAITLLIVPTEWNWIRERDRIVRSINEQEPVYICL